MTQIEDYLSRIGKLGGSKTTDLKKKTSAKNGTRGLRPHWNKVDHFEKVFKYKLVSNEWLEKIVLPIKTKTGRPKTYNPDYYCDHLKCFIEVATSYPNISAQGKIWNLASKIKPLRIFWWTGQEITEKVLD